MSSLFLAYRNARYTVVRPRIPKLIEEDHGDECVRMESIMSDSNMIHQNKTEEYGCVRKIEEFPLKKNIPK